MDVITYPCWVLSWTKLVKGAPVDNGIDGNQHWHIISWVIVGSTILVPSVYLSIK